MQDQFLARSILTVFLFFPATTLFSQQIVVGTPFNSLNDGYYEQYGVAWGLNWRGGHARFGMPNPAIPPFGKYDPSAGLRTGWRFGNGNFNGNIFFHAAQGSYRSFTSQTPFVTLMNGYQGAFYDQSLSPFVTGYVPVVGDYPTAGPNSLDRVQVMRRLLASQNQGKTSDAEEPDPGEAMLPRHANSVTKTEDRSPSTQTRAQTSSADKPVPSVAEAKRLHELEKNAADQETLALMERAQAAAEEGKPQVAKIYYQMVVRRAQGEIKQTAERRLQELQLEKR
jgi:hypothetical protein